MTVLLDANVLVALVSPDHVHHDAAQRWTEQSDFTSFATCPITEGAFVRWSVRDGHSASDVQAVLRAVHSREGHEFWADALGYADVDLSHVAGHRQVTDAYLAALARHKGGMLATFDRGLAASHPDVAELIPLG